MPNICCRPSFPLCLNGGTCVVNGTDTTKRFQCQCPNGYYGNQCQVWKPKTCMDYWIDRVKPLPGEYVIVNSNGQSYNVFCDFDSETDMAWTLIESFDTEHENQLNSKSFAVDFPRNEHTLNWKLFRLPKSLMSEISSCSNYWRATCSFSKYGVDFRDYIRVQLSVMNLLIFTGYYTSTHPCLEVDYFDVKGKSCERCTMAFIQNSEKSLHLKLKYSREERNCSFDSLSVEYECSEKTGYTALLLGQYTVNCRDPNARCSENPNSTTEFWFGAKRND